MFNSVGYNFIHVATCIVKGWSTFLIYFMRKLLVSLLRLCTGRQNWLWLLFRKSNGIYTKTNTLSSKQNQDTSFTYKIKIFAIITINSTANNYKYQVKLNEKVNTILGLLILNFRQIDIFENINKFGIWKQ